MDNVGALILLWTISAAVLIVWATRSDRALIALCVLVFGTLLLVGVLSTVAPVCYGPNAASCLEERQGGD